MDLHMPELDGTEIIEPFRKHADTPVILISAYLDDAEVEQLKQVGIRHFLQKPFTLSELRKVVNAALRDCPG